MAGFPVGMIALLIVSVLIYFGLAQRVLDRLQLSDKAALAIVAAMIVGSFINIPLPVPRVNASLNVGGGLVPLLVAVYLLWKAGTAKEWIRALVATVLAGGVVFYINRYLMPRDPWQAGYDVIDPLYIYPIVAGAIAYLAGRSRRSAFIAATLGVLSLDVVDFIYYLTTAIPGRVSIGGAGIFDGVVLAGLFAVLLAEIVGETRERLQGGPESEGRPEDLVEGLKDINSAKVAGGPEPARKPETERGGERNEQKIE
ncbi:DUF1614 domain-containing protein [Calderihabitans maritimus]|uniref:DUF1614 domain-containing protein n=1 Tax=Calderihabitans maritimus TaxID=1246530 RepID=A0A1Z5HVB8_9FIRM|nr:DUF1614 domain-containing protein [Calderihabitans maritimus]GAW93230.1 hypothetical protein TherJR_1589 [Calderihabitans maritimus]